MTTKDIQDVSLDITKHIHEVCIKNGIKYSLGYGSLIGAVRHKGFIPWDNDVDIIMLRKEYDRFCQVFEDTEEYKLFSNHRGNMYAPLARVCDMKRTFVKTYTPMFKEKTGVFVDVFPMDYVDDDKALFLKKADRLERMTKLEQIKRGALYGIFEAGLTPIKILKQIAKKAYSFKYDIDELVRQHDEEMLYLYDTPTRHVCNISMPRIKEHLPINIFDNYLKVPFEDTEVMIVEGYDECLRITFGDYMQLPPENKRVPGHDYHKHYWKD